MTDRDQEKQVAESLSHLEGLMTATAQKAVDATLQRLGIDTSNPLQAQQDFARLRIIRKLMEDENFQLDLAFIRRWRTNSEKITDTSLKTFIRWVIVGLLGIAALVTKDWWITHFKG